MISEVTTLQHEVGDDAVEYGALETESFLPCAECTEILSSLRHNIWTKLKGIRQDIIN